jgi:hypothetical protein
MIFLEILRLASRDQFGVDDGKPFKHCNVTKPLIAAVEMIDRCNTMDAECDRKLNRVQ